MEEQQDDLELRFFQSITCNPKHNAESESVIRITYGPGFFCLFFCLLLQKSAFSWIIIEFPGRTVLAHETSFEGAKKKGKK